MFEKQLRFIDSLPSLLANVSQRAIEQHDDVLKDFIVEKQLFEKGIDGDGKRLKGYSRRTIKIKLSKKPPQPVDRTTTRDTGEFHRRIEIVARSDGFEVRSNVPYDKFILKRYGRKILKITDGNLRLYYLKFVTPSLKTEIRKALRK